MNKKYFDMIDGERKEKVQQGIKDGILASDGINCFGSNVFMTRGDGQMYQNAEGERQWLWQDIIQPQQVLRFDWWTGEYYAIQLDNDLMKRIVDTFGKESNQIAWNLDHRGWFSTEAYGWTRKIRLSNETIQGETQWTADTITDYLQTDKYKYVSAELSYANIDEAMEKDQHPSHLTGVALTNVPAIRNMNQVSLSLGLPGFEQGDLAMALSKYTQVFMPDTSKEDVMPEETKNGGKSVTDEKYEKLLEDLKAERQKNLELSIDGDFKDVIDNGRTSPAHVEEYKKDILASATPRKDKDIILKVLKNNPENSVVDLSKLKGETKADPDPEDDDNGREAFIANKINELVAAGVSEYDATRQAVRIYDAKAEKEDDTEDKDTNGE